jgi:hypothetical protein
MPGKFFFYLALPWYSFLAHARFVSFAILQVPPFDELLRAGPLRWAFPSNGPSPVRLEAPHPLRQPSPLSLGGPLTCPFGRPSLVWFIWPLGASLLQFQQIPSCCQCHPGFPCRSIIFHRVGHPMVEYPRIVLQPRPSHKSLSIGEILLTSCEALVQPQCGEEVKISFWPC